MKERPYHHLPDGTFRNPKGSPVIISRSGKFSYRTFSKLRKKVDLSYPKEHDKKDRKKKINIPIQVLWGKKGVVGTQFYSDNMNSSIF